MGVPRPGSWWATMVPSGVRVKLSKALAAGGGVAGSSVGGLSGLVGDSGVGLGQGLRLSVLYKNV